MEKRKNIHLLPTDKGQRITKTSKGTLLWCSKSAEDFIEIRKGYLGFHLYITSDEEIKEGDWFLHNNTVEKLPFDDRFKDKEYKHYFFAGLNCKKIILTTDLELQKDGVQAIDDEFLEWFVKNPSCEFVEVKKGFADGTAWGYNFLDYKIIIPQEEPKKETQYLDEMPNVDKKLLAKMWEDTIPRVDPKRGVFLMNAHGVIDTREPKQETLNVKQNTHYVDFSNPNADKISSASTTSFKQETLEEAAEKYAKTAEGIDIPYQNGLYYGFVEGAKWQAERMYSEEDMRKAFKDGSWVTSWSDMGISMKYDTFEEWFEQFKKK